MSQGNYVLTFVRQLKAGVVVLIALTAIVGVAYPAAVWAVSRFDTHAAEGSPLADSNGCVVGSELIGVDPQIPLGDADPFFHLRVVGSVTSGDAFAPGDPAAALPSNQGPSSESLARFIEERRTVIALREGVPPEEVPVDAITGSGSGVDPHISPAYAALQVPRVARALGIPEQEVRQLVADHTDGRQLGFLGAERVDVPGLNIALGATAPHCAPASPGG